MTLSLLKTAFVLVAVSSPFFANAFWDSSLPVTVVDLAIYHAHFAFAMAYAIIELSFVDVAVCKFEGASAVWATVLMLTQVRVA